MRIAAAHDYASFVDRYPAPQDIGGHEVTHVITGTRLSLRRDSTGEDSGESWKFPYVAPWDIQRDKLEFRMDGSLESAARTKDGFRLAATNSQIYNGYCEVA